MLLVRAAKLIGTETVKVIAANDGWPGHLLVHADGGTAKVAAFIGPIGRSHRRRDLEERRFQNPLRADAQPGQGAGKVIVVPTGYRPLLLGLWEEEGKPILVAADATRRSGRATRYSVFVPLELLKAALAQDWSQQTNSDGELLTAFDPPLFSRLLTP
jgi:hypothetical protein